MVIKFAFIFKSRSKIANLSGRANKGSAFYVHQVLIKKIIK